MYNKRSNDRIVLKQPRQLADACYTLKAVVGKLVRVLIFPRHVERHAAEAPIESIGMMSLLKELPTMSSLCGSTRSVRHNDRHAALHLSATIST